jgi:hypothetical protein
MESKQSDSKHNQPVAPEHEGSSQYSQQPATRPNPEPTGSTLHSPIQSP